MPPSRGGAGTVSPFFSQPLTDLFPSRLPAGYFSSLLVATENSSRPSQCRGSGGKRAVLYTMRSSAAASPPQRLEGGTQWPRHQLFSPLTCAQLFDPVLKQKEGFLEATRDYNGRSLFCHLCEEPAPRVAAHCAYWDHVTRYVGVRLTANYLAHMGRTGNAQPKADDKKRKRKAVVDKCGGCSAALLEASSSPVMAPASAAVRWSAREVLADAAVSLPAGFLSRARPHPTLFHLVEAHGKQQKRENRSTSGEHGAGRREDRLPVYCLPHERDDAVRRAELTALLQLLHETPREGEKAHREQVRHRLAPGSLRSSATPPMDGIRPVLFDSLHLARHTIPMANLGERTFRSIVGKRVMQLLPPMGPEATTRVQQRCWGRRNLEILFDLLQIGDLQARAGSPQIATTKNDKGSVMRQMVQELVTVQRMLQRCDHDVESAGKKQANDQATSIASSARTTITAPSNAARHARNVKLVLIEEALQRLAFELVYMQSTDFMRHAGRAYALLGFPSEAELEQSGYY